MATGYLHHYPYLPDGLRYSGPNTLAPAGLYKGVMWMGEGNGRMMYIGMPDQIHSFNMFDVQARWAIMVSAGAINLPGQEDMANDAKEWADRYDNDQFHRSMRMILQVH